MSVVVSHVVIRDISQGTENARREVKNAENVGDGIILKQPCKNKGQKHATSKKTVTVRQVEHSSSDQSDHPGSSADYALSINDGESSSIGTVKANVVEVDMSFIIDSGASCNVIDRDTWELLKSKSSKCSCHKVDKILYSYGSEQPLKTAGSFKTQVQVGDCQTNAECIVIEGSEKALLGRDTAIKLKVLSLGQINVLRTSEILDKFPELTNGVGKLKDYQLEIPVDHGVQPVAQPTRRIPRKT